jgi:hypothetical protein
MKSAKLKWALEEHLEALGWVLEVSPAPKFREISRNREFSENSTEFFLNWSKTPQKASKYSKNVEKAPKNSTEFLHICQKHPKKLSKSSQIKKKIAQDISAFVPKKAPEKLPNSGDTSILRHLWWVQDWMCSLPYPCPLQAARGLVAQVRGQ